MRVTRLELDHIGPFERAVVELPKPEGTGELIVFEGPNGSGKTTIVEVLAFAAGSLASGLAQSWMSVAHGRWTKRLRRETSLHVTLEEGDARLRMTVEVPREPGTPRISHEATPKADNPVVAMLHAPLNELLPGQRVPWALFTYAPHRQSASLATDGPRTMNSPFSRALSEAFRDNDSPAALGQLLVNLEYERMKAALAAQELPSEAERAAMASTSAQRKEALARIEWALSRAVDRAVKVRFPFGQQAPEVTFDGEAIPIDLLGEGIRSTFSWVADLLVQLELIPWADTARSPMDQPFWLILDEIDEGLHPSMQARILPVVRELFANAHIYATTHSPFVVASVGEGHVARLRPDKDHKVRGSIAFHRLEPGQPLEWVTSEIFGTVTGFVDRYTRDRLAEHKREVRRFQRSGSLNWDAFFARRGELMKLNDEVRAVVAMQEVPIRLEIDRRMLDRDEGREQETDA